MTIFQNIHYPILTDKQMNMEKNLFNSLIYSLLRFSRYPLTLHTFICPRQYVNIYSLKKRE